MWDGISIGDALLNEYDTEHMAFFNQVMFHYDTGEEGVIAGYGGELRVLKVGNQALEMRAGAALVNGTFYESNSSMFWSYTYNDGEPTNYYRVVLRKDIDSQVVRMVVVGPSNTTYPTLLQNADSIWELPLAKFYTTDGVVGEVTDERVHCKSPLTRLLSWRQGGDSLYWIEPGTDNYSPQFPLVQSGCDESLADGTLSVTFPEEFSQQPILYVTIEDSSMAWSVFTPSSLSYTGFTGVLRDRLDNAAGAHSFYWMAIGPP
jgi:hypothetical protein